MAHIKWFVFVLATLQISLINAGGLKILGGFTEVYSITSTVLHGRQYKWGAHQTSQQGTQVLTITQSYCWNTFTRSRGYCYLKIIASTQNNANEEYYEILGTKQVIMDAPSTYIDRTSYQYEQQTVGEGESDITVYSGECWSPGNRAWGYGYLHFIVERRSNRAPVTDAFSRQAHNGGSEIYTQAEQFFGSRSSSSKRHKIGAFRCWTTAWGEDSYCYTYIWRAQTRLVSYSLRYDDKEILGVGEVPKVRPLILENHGSGLSTLEFPRIENSEKITTTSTARFSRTFDFSIDISTEVGFDAFGASASIGFNTHFGYSSTSEMDQSIENSATVSITWPSNCDAGFRVTYRVVEYSETQRIPVDFKFERADDTWTETNDVDVTLKWIEVNADDCCLYDYAHEECGTERLPMC